jgi:hypothetical protein
MSRPAAIDENSNVAQLEGATPTSISAAPNRARALWAWATIACLLLGSSAVFRIVQDRRHKDEKNYVESCPFPLKQISSKLGIWRMKEGGDQSLDSQTMKVTGGTDHILRTYVDDLTGVALVVLVLFGPAEPVLPHVPEVCYPATGYSSAQDTLYRKIKYTTKDSSGRDVPGEAFFRSSVYEKPGGLLTRREEAYHSFRLEGKWSPDVGVGRKFVRRTPGAFKVQVQRMVAPGENRETDNPVDQFLSMLVPEIERRVAAASAQEPVAGR